MKNKNLITEFKTAKDSLLYLSNTNLILGFYGIYNDLNSRINDSLDKLGEKKIYSHEIFKKLQKEYIKNNLGTNQQDNKNIRFLLKDIYNFGFINPQEYFTLIFKTKGDYKKQFTKLKNFFLKYYFTGYKYKNIKKKSYFNKKLFLGFSDFLNENNKIKKIEHWKDDKEIANFMGNLINYMISSKKFTQKEINNLINKKELDKIIDNFNESKKGEIAKFTNKANQKFTLLTENNIKEIIEISNKDKGIEKLRKIYNFYNNIDDNKKRGQSISYFLSYSLELNNIKTSLNLNYSSLKDIFNINNLITNKKQINLIKNIKDTFINIQIGIPLYLKPVFFEFFRKSFFDRWQNRNKNQGLYNEFQKFKQILLGSCDNKNEYEILLKFFKWLEGGNDKKIICFLGIMGLICFNIITFIGSFLLFIKLFLIKFSKNKFNKYKYRFLYYPGVLMITLAFIYGNGFSNLETIYNKFNSDNIKNIYTYTNINIKNYEKSKYVFNFFNSSTLKASILNIPKKD